MGCAPAHAGELALLQHAQQAGLGLWRHVADLVEEQRAAGGLLEAALAAVHGAGEGAALVTEQLALDQLARDRRHVDGHERGRAAAPVVVQRARHELLAGAALAVDHHREVGGREAGDGAVDLLHRLGAADQGQPLLGVARLARALLRGRRDGQGAADHGQQLLEVERLGQVLEGAALGGLHRGHQRGLGAHHQHPQLRAHPLDAQDEVEPVLVGHHHVGDHEVALAVLHPAPQRGRVAGRADLVARPPQRLREHGAYGAIVIGDEDGGQRHGGGIQGSARRGGAPRVSGRVPEP